MRSNVLFWLTTACCTCSPQPVPAASFIWTQLSADEFSLFRDGVQIGGYRLSEAAYYPRCGPGCWGEPCALPPGAMLPPVAGRAKSACPCCGENCKCSAGRPCGKPGCSCVLAGVAVQADGTLNFGVDLKSVGKARRTIKGREATKPELLQTIGKPRIADDSAQLCVTVIGADSERQIVLDDLDGAPSLQDWKGKIRVQGYEPTHWAVKDAGFVTSGHPTIYCQAPNGKVLHRQDEYRGPEPLAEALRQADRNYRSANDPDLDKPYAAWLAEIESWLSAVPVWAWLVIALILYLRFFHKETRP